LKITKSKLREIIRQVIREADESDKYSHIGYGRYKEKGKEDDKDAETFQKTDSGKFEPFEKEKGEENPEPKQTKIAADPFGDKDSETGKDYTKKFIGTDEPEDEDDDPDYGGEADISHDVEKAEENWIDDDQPDTKDLWNWHEVLEKETKMTDGSNGFNEGDIKRAENLIDAYDNAINGRDEEEAEEYMNKLKMLASFRESPEFRESILPQLKKEFKQYDFLRHSNNWRK
jgi:hypothetical protein